MRFLGFIGPTYELSSVNVDCQRCVNLYPELNEIGTGKDREIASLLGTPGLRLLATLPANGCRGSIYTSTGQLFAVYGANLYQIASDFTFTLKGTLITTSGQVSMADNGLQLVIVDNPNGYVWDFTALTFTQITDTNYKGASQVTYQDGFFIFNEVGTNHFFLSDLNSTAFLGDVASKEGDADPILSIISDHRNLWLFGSETTEVWYNSGDNTFPFARIDGAYIQTGCAAANSVQRLNGTVIWLGCDKNGTGIVYEASGYQPVRISNQSVERAIQGYSTISDAISWTYQDDGHNFYVLSFPTANATWVFDTQTKLWHERAYLINGNFNRHRGATHAFAYGKHVVGDWENGNLYELTRDVFDDNGNPKKWMRRSPHVSSDMNKQFFAQFQLDVETGVGLDGTTQGTDPQVMLRFSDDGGHTWSNEKWTSMGKIGHTRARVQWQRLGSSRNRVFEVSGSDPVKIALIGAELNFMAGAS